MTTRRTDDGSGHEMDEMDRNCTQIFATNIFFYIAFYLQYF